MTDDQPKRATCPKCGDDMLYVTAIAHPNAPAMRRTIFVCYPCNRTWNYTLSAEMAAAYAPSDAITAAYASNDAVAAARA